MLCLVFFVKVIHFRFHSFLWMKFSSFSDIFHVWSWWCLLPLVSYRACVSWCQYNGAQHDPPKYVNHHRLRGRQGPETANQQTQSGWWSNHKPMKSSLPLSGFLDHDQNLNNFLHSLLYKIRKIDKIPCCASSKIHLSLSWNHSAPFKNFWLTYNIPLLLSMRLTIWLNTFFQNFSLHILFVKSWLWPWPPKLSDHNIGWEGVTLGGGHCAPLYKDVSTCHNHLISPLSVIKQWECSTFPPPNQKKYLIAKSWA